MSDPTAGRGGRSLKAIPPDPSALTLLVGLEQGGAAAAQRLRPVLLDEVLGQHITQEAHLGWANQWDLEKERVWG